ncbi:hypothetical protein O164_14220 [Pseudomonas taiwanensis SJ9]|uniref:Uncharacterized protein n=1 Tax=Pseudomonas taiwanensis SJ9 TaxID=1388762 RepID=V7D9V3_9PSED|nr:hypothetical protein O164_14220 [Pseudomonas taiwanensis SJ9]
MMAADRAVRLVRYEVYRLSTYEPGHPNAAEVFIIFYRSLSITLFSQLDENSPQRSVDILCNTL